MMRPTSFLFLGAVLSSVTACAIDDRELILTDTQGRPLAGPTPGSGGNTGAGAAEGTSGGNSNGGGTNGGGENGGGENGGGGNVIQPPPGTGGNAPTFTVLPLPEGEQCFDPPELVTPNVDELSAANALSCGAGTEWVTHGIGIQSDEISGSGEFFGAVFDASGLSDGHCRNDYDQVPLCVAGSLRADYEAFGMVGWNVQQTFDDQCTSDASAEGEITTAFHQNVTVDLQIAPATTALMRVQLSDLDANIYCYDIPAAAGLNGKITIPLSDFRLNCWEPDAPAYNQDDSIRQVAVTAASHPVQVGSNERSAYSFCVYDIFFDQ